MWMPSPKHTTIYKLVVHEGIFSKNYNDLFVTYKMSILASCFKNQKLVENIYTTLLLNLSSEEKKKHTHSKFLMNRLKSTKQVIYPNHKKIVYHFYICFLGGYHFLFLKTSIFCLYHRIQQHVTNEQFLELPLGFS